MSKVKIEGNASGTGTFTIQAPNSNSDRVLSLPDGAGEILTDASSLPAANLTGTLPAIDGSNLTGITSGTGNYQVLYSANGSSVSSITVSNVPSWASEITIAFQNFGPASTAPMWFRLRNSSGNITNGYENWGKQIGGSSITTPTKRTSEFQISHSQPDGVSGVWTLQKASSGWALMGSVVDLSGDTALLAMGHLATTDTITGVYIFPDAGNFGAHGSISVTAKGEV